MRHIVGFVVVSAIGLLQPLLGGLGNPDPVTVTQPDGSTFLALIRGDEHRSWVETEDGHTVVKNGSNGFWEYALRAKTGRLEPSGIAVGRPGSVAPAGSRQLRPSPVFLESTWQRARGKKANWSPQPIGGERNLLVMLVSFADRPLQTTSQQWHQAIFDTSPGAKSVANFYRDNSYGKLTIHPVAHGKSGDPPGILTLGLPMNHPNFRNGEQYSSLQQRSNEETSFINQVLGRAANYVDFPGLDKNSSGLLSTDELNIYMILSGYDSSATTQEPGVWAHAWGSLSQNQVRAGSVEIRRWAMQGELETNDQQFAMGVTAHELGHSIFNLPDLYDTASVNAGIGVFSLMGGGSWGNLPGERGGTNPAIMDAWCRYYLGWAEPRVPQHGERLDFPGALTRVDAPVFLRDPANPNEYFLVENRVPDLWDQGITVDLTVPTETLSDGTTAYDTSGFIYAPIGVAEGLAVACGLGRPEEFPSEVEGNIALILRGELTFRDKVLNAKDAGAVGVVIYNNQPSGMARGTLGNPDQYIPVVGIAGSDGPPLENVRVRLEIVGHQHQGGLLVVHVDENGGPRLNDSEENQHQGVIALEATQEDGSLLDNTSSGHITHLFYQGNNATVSGLIQPGSMLHNGQRTRGALTDISPQGPEMQATYTRVGELGYTVPWVVNNTQWLSKLAFFNLGQVADTATVVAMTQDGKREEIALPMIQPGGVHAFDSGSLLQELTGFSLFVYGSEIIYPSFLTYNLDALSGRSPAQTTGMASHQLSDTLLFAYLQSLPGGAAAVVLVAPEKKSGESTTVSLSLFGPNGRLVDDRTLQLSGNQPVAKLAADLFDAVPEDAAILARANDGSRLAGTTFVFNDSLEPAMSLPFNQSVGSPGSAVIPWVVDNAQWLSRVAIFNGSSFPERVVLEAVATDGTLAQKTIDIPGEAVFAAHGGELFPGMSGYSIYLDSQNGQVFPSFLTYNLEAASGFSPAQTTGRDFEVLTDRLVFSYLNTTEGGVSAVVVSAPEAEPGQETPVVFTLFMENGQATETVQVQLQGKRPLARVLADLFSSAIPENAAVTARSIDGSKLAGTTFVFNGLGEPSMSVPFSQPL